MASPRRCQRIAAWASSWTASLACYMRRRLRCRIYTEDLTREVSGRLLRVEQLEQIKEPQAYLYRVASNVAAEWRMRAVHSKPHSDVELERLVASTTPESILDDTLLAAQLDSALDSMTPMVRAVIYLK